MTIKCYVNEKFLSSPRISLATQNTPTSGSNIVFSVVDFNHKEQKDDLGSLNIDDFIHALEKDPVIKLDLTKANERISGYVQNISGKVTFTSLRLAAGYSQVSLARQIGVPQPTIARWESGSSVNPTLDKLRALSSTLNVTIDEISLAFKNQWELVKDE